MMRADFKKSEFLSLLFEWVYYKQNIQLTPSNIKEMCYKTKKICSYGKTYVL